MATVLPKDEYKARLKQYADDHDVPHGSGFFGHWAHFVRMERQFQQETGHLCDPGPPSSARPGSFKEYVKKASD